MTLKQLIKLEDKAKEVWVISPTLHYDTESKDFSELVSVNRGEKTKYRYIVPATKTIRKHMKMYKKMYKLSSEEMANNFLLLPPSAFSPFIMETALYNPNGKCIACVGPALEDTDDVIRLSSKAAKSMAKKFRKTWKKIKMVNP